MFQTISKYFNPELKHWEDVNVVIDKKLNFDYSSCKWIAIDGEFTGLYPQRDKSTLWTIASEDENKKMRVEMLYTFNDDADISKFAELLKNQSIEKLFFYSKLDLAYLYKLVGFEVSQPIYDVKIASIISRTHTQSHSIKPLVQTYISSTESIIDKSAIENTDWVTDYKNWSSETFQYNVNDVVYLKFLSEKIKEIAKLSGREKLVDAANKALPYVATLYANGFYRDVFKHGYNDADIQG